MKLYFLGLISFLVLLTGCQNLDPSTVPILFSTLALKGPILTTELKQETYEYPKYAVVEKHAKEANLEITDSKAYIKLLLAPKGYKVYATLPDYEIKGAGLVVHVALVGLDRKISQKELTLIDPRVRNILTPLAKKLEGKLIKVDPNKENAEDGLQPPQI